VTHPTAAQGSGRLWRAGCRILRRRASSARDDFALLANSRYSFTIIELLIVMAIIIVLAGLVLGTAGYVQKKGARSRAEAEIAAMSAALESYKADNGAYPREAQTTDTLDARQPVDSNKYARASLFLYTELSGLGANGSAVAGAKSYFTFKPQMLSGTRTNGGQVSSVSAIRDPFGNSYGYSTAYAADLETSGGTAPTHGFNPTYDLWSTGGAESTAANSAEWIKNW
jgi:type II secretory pathway pseudopilin PulG